MGPAIHLTRRILETAITRRVTAMSKECKKQVKSAGRSESTDLRGRSAASLAVRWKVANINARSLYTATGTQAAARVEESLPISRSLPVAAR